MQTTLTTESLSKLSKAEYLRLVVEAAVKLKSDYYRALADGHLQFCPSKNKIAREAVKLVNACIKMIDDETVKQQQDHHEQHS